MTQRPVAVVRHRSTSERDFAEAGPIPPAHVESLVALAVRAPSVHNTQPWRFVYTADGTIELRIDPDRALPIADPAARELVISCGAALQNLRLGLRRLALVPAVLLSPDLDDPLLLARVRARSGPSATYDEGLLVEAIPRRHTHRGGFDSDPVTEDERELIGNAARGDGVDLHFVAPGQLAGGLAALALFADDAQRIDPEVRAELAAWTSGPGSTRPDGVPTTAYSRPGPESQRTGALPARDFGLGRGWGWTGRTGGGIATLAVLVTDGDTLTDWIRAGEALQGALLTATALWVFASFATQPIEVPHTREALRALLGTVGADGYPQMLIELGHASSLLLTPRRAVGDVLHHS
jgi:nitroreductase